MASGGAGPEERKARSERREVKPKEELSPEEKEKGAVAEVSEEAFNEEEKAHRAAAPKSRGRTDPPEGVPAHVWETEEREGEGAASSSRADKRPRSPSGPPPGHLKPGRSPFRPRTPGWDPNLRKNKGVKKDKRNDEIRTFGWSSFHATKGRQTARR